MSIVKRGHGDVAVKVEESQSDIVILKSMRDTAEAHYSDRCTPPAHYTIKIDSFSKLCDVMLEDGTKCYTSQIFEAGGSKWKLSLYPKGDEEGNGNGHISMYLNIEDTKDLPIGWEVNVVYKFFVLDQLRHKSFTIEDALRRTSRFNATKTCWGIRKLLPCSTFEDNRNGFLIEDTCVFGAEVLVISPTSTGECISPVKDFCDYTYKWKIYLYSSYTQKYHDSDIFTPGNFEWILRLHPKGDEVGTDDKLSLYLYAYGLDARTEVNAEYKLCIQDQRGAKHREYKGSHWFTSPCSHWGYPKFLSLDDFNDPSSGLLMKDGMIIIEVRITNISTTMKRSSSLFYA